ncbi:MAG: 50S ribosomal protein L18 [Chloroflexi bacterium RBG_16_50_11]|nr:MAG: 50S ribosomal protein L18 [Chloroflexi bacterium RBG_16_50_11]
MTKSYTREARLRRHRRVRQTVSGNGSRPRLSVFRSLNHIYAQVIDDVKGQTLVTASTLDAEVKKDSKKKNKTGWAELVGTLLAKRAVEKKITQVAFDRGGFKYQGRVKALAEAARKGGLKF